MNLFNIEKEYLELIDQIQELEGELTPELEEALYINAKELEHKVKAYHYIIQMNKGEISIIDDEIARLNKLKQVKSNLIDKLKERLLTATLLFGEDGKSGNKKLSFDTLKLYTVHKKGLELDEEKMLQEKDYVSITVTKSIPYNTYLKFKDFVPEVNLALNKTLITEDLLSGVELEGARIIDKPHVVIK